MKTRTFISTGHLIDSGIMSEIFNTIMNEGADYEVTSFDIGKMKSEKSKLELVLKCKKLEELEILSNRLTSLGAYEKGAFESVFKIANKDCNVPEDFYSTSNHRTEIFIDGKWENVGSQRMDAVIVLTEKGPCCVKLRDVRTGDHILCGSESVRVFPPVSDIRDSGFGFMSNEVSSERSDNIAVIKIAEELKSLKKEGKETIVVAGPVVIHTGGGSALAGLIRDGWIHGLLGGNAIAVHDIESCFYGTSLGVNLETGKQAVGGHYHHMRAINRINQYGSIKNAVEAKALKSGLMYEIVKADIPYSLAGSIRDDGPLPETEMDMIKAQREYSKIIKDTDMIIMLSTMLHSIGTGNMTPSWVKTVCVDINPSVVTKLSDRGTSQAVGIVSDVGLFLRALAAKLEVDH
ncbi:MAG: TIGR00300 family protein [Spirochaetia bacterium]|jgi:lysine-ketoglutarate reductase/saccharopine dehydrogenase-like protein (TIGR00300 family)|nr:TIGR00300 family protein [Spirochaetia bacterium]